MTRYIPIAGLALGVLAAGPGHAQVLEVIHPEIEKGGFEVELLSGVRLDSVDSGEEKGVYEFAIGYAPTDYWKPKIAFEIADPKGGTPVLEAIEIENLFLFYGAGGHGHNHGHHHGDETGLRSAGLFTVLEIPQEGGISDGAFALGPVAEWGLGGANLIGNLFLEFPFEDGEDPALSYAAQISWPVAETQGAEYALGFEAHGEIEEVFDGGSISDGTHFFGPAVYAEFDVGRGRVIEPRLGVFAGLTDESPDAVASLNVELKF
ncbi:MAG: hypothetical protein LC676_17730 [Loktanella sp.]|nr:hypothetical protein [Loktanella sp.]